MTGVLVLIDGAIIVLVTAIITVLHGRAAARMVRARGRTVLMRWSRRTARRRAVQPTRGSHTRHWQQVAASLEDTQAFKAVSR